MDYRQLLLQFIGSLTLADHLGDVTNEISYVLKKLDMGHIEWDELSDLSREFGKLGITTLYGTSLKSDED